MNIFLFLLILVGAVLALLGYLWYLASTGDPMAITVLSGGGVFLIFVAFSLLDAFKDWIRDRAETRRFQDNMRENLNIAVAGQRLMNQQLLGAKRQGLLGSGQPQHRLGLDDNAVLDIDEYTYE